MLKNKNQTQEILKKRKPNWGNIKDKQTKQGHLIFRKKIKGKMGKN